MSPVEVKIQRAAPGDIPALVALMHDFYAESAHVLDAAWAAQSFRQLLANPALGCVWMAYAGTELVGHTVLTLRYTMEHGALGGHVDDLYVKPGFRRMGVARMVLTALVAECRARGCKSLYVEVGGDNVAARRLYEQHGLLPFQDGRILLAGTVS